jgi:transglutaminase-like putative cysteine protease
MTTARYHIEHETRYVYTAPVSQSWQLARLTPRWLPWQTLLQQSIHIEPPPDERHDARDSFGNTVTHFGLHGAHRVLSVRMQCTVDVADRYAAGWSPASMSDMPDRPWEVERDSLKLQVHADDLSALSLTEATPLLPLSEAARVYAEASLQPGWSWMSAVSDLMRRIHVDFEFEAGVTTVSTSVDEVLAQRRGVCQDFAHLMLACLRSHGLPARYVSGYLLTDPPEGQPRLMGVDASHAWVAAYAPGAGWIEFDPTNNQLADSRYITLAWGADFADVVPLRGVILGGGSQSMQVRVSVVPVD